MAKLQQNVSLSSPGFWGINTQDSPIDMDYRFCREANNCVIDFFGRVSSRRGFQYMTTNPNILEGNPIESIYEFIRQDTGESYVIACGNNALYLQQQEAPFELVPLGLPAGYTVSDNNWDFATLNNKCYLVQSGQKSLVFDPAADDTVLREWAEYPQNSANGTVSFNSVCAAFGRLWVSSFDDDSGVFEWSGLLDGENWSSAGHGGAQTGLYWPSGYDSITAISAHNNFLIVFGRTNILVYTTTSDVASTLNLSDTIEGIGCIARDSIVATGNDHMFASATGIRAFNRTIQEKSLPIGDISRNVRDEFQEALSNEVEDDIKAVFHVEDSFYACFLPTNPLTYVFDTWEPLPNGSGRATTWTQVRPRCGVRLESRETLFAGAGGVYFYRGGNDLFLNPVDSVTEVIQNIPMSFITHPFDFGDPSIIKFPKQVDVTIVNSFGGDLTLRWGYDYARTIDPRSVTEKLTDASNFTLYYPGGTPTTEPFVGEYEDPNGPTSASGKTAVYTSQSPTVNELRYNIWGSGRNISLGFYADALGAPLSIQQIDIQALTGRIR